MTTPKPRPSESLAELRRRADSGHWNDDDWAAALISAKAECDRLRDLNAEMLEVLKLVVEDFAWHADDPAVFKLAHQVIAKAEGTIR